MVGLMSTFCLKDVQPLHLLAGLGRLFQMKQLSI
jgi:hypothetical protein